MFGVIVTEGKTVEKAVLKAAFQLRVSVEEVEYEVLDQGYRGFLWTRNAVIQASTKRQSNKHDDMLYQSSGEFPGTRIHLITDQKDHEVNTSSSIHTSRDLALEGTVWTKDGVIHCSNGRNHYPLLTTCEGLTLTVNGEVKTGTVIISQEDKIEVEIHNDSKESTYHITVSEDKMYVTLELKTGINVVKYLKDQTPHRELILEIVETNITINNLTEKLVYEELNELGVKFGIDHDAIQRVCQSQDSITCVIAKGIEPTRGHEGFFDLFSKTREEEKNQFIISDTVDWKERYSLPTVKAGDVIGRPIPAKPGVNGRNVFGEDVSAKAGINLSIITGEGTTLFGADRMVVATSSGRIKVQKRSNNTVCFSILPQHVHTGNVNIRSGNIRFHGDVYIIGNIEEGMIVEAGGNLHITGNVTNSTIRANGDVVINGAVIGTDIICGHLNLLWDDLIPSFKLVREDLMKLIRAAEQLEANRSFSKSDIATKGLQPLLRLLTEVKFKELPNRIRDMNAIVSNKKANFDEDTQQIIEFLEKAFLYYHPMVSHLKQLEAVVSSMGSVISIVEYDSNKKVNIKVQSLTNSSIKSAWNVAVERFCYGSDIYCQGAVQVGGILRGGKVQAGSFAFITGEIGSNGGSQTEVWITSDKGYVKADLVWPDTLIKIATSAKKFINQEASVHVRMNDRGILDLR